jgi:HME family heavy-metal exporter
MFNFLVSASLRNRLFVLAATLILIAYGAVTLRTLPVDVFPDLNRPTVTLVAEAEGLAPEEVEQLVTFLRYGAKPLERLDAVQAELRPSTAY